MNRENLIDKISEQEKIWDVVVIGGGASGLGIAIEAVTRGYKTLLLEQYDFTKGTSSRSTKLVHGGVRYLAQGNISLVLESLKERGLLQKNAPHLVSNLAFLIPSYTWWGIPFYTIGLILYDLLAGKLTFGKSKPQSKLKTLAKIPTLIKKNLRGSVLYHDGQFDDSRLGLNMAQTIIQKGGTAINYVKVCNFLKENSIINGVIAQDFETKIEYKIKAKTVINATGIFVDEILQKDNPEAKDIVKPSQGVHLILDKEFLPHNYGLMIPKTKDGRVLFAVPWHHKVILGTTDVLKEVSVIEPKATDKEIDFILETAGRYLTKKPTRKDIKSVFAGLRPLAIPKNKGKKTKEISRGHKIYKSKSGLITIIGGKWTTYRQMGQDVINKMELIKKLPKKKSITSSLHLYGYKEKVDFKDLLYFYGSDINYIKELILSNSKLEEWVSENLQIKKAQIVWACKNEMARTVEDFLARRTRALFLDAKESVRTAPIVAEIMANELGYNKEWEKSQIEKYTMLANSYFLK
ncbi:MAG: glycerol-3-phosphate dehydrogenase/oxidase [Lutibacter sp.]|nr:glycerol-3-phosphate dehydrogenase/oxidase [Lutibacter sp.]MCF6168571.1 glycerol-3-phosphate dehydrogenase/oxidase [Lutibacter sp.]